MEKELDNVKVGDGITYHMYSDSKALTVIKKTERMIVATIDDQKLADDWRPEIIPGGFAGHCINQNSQRWVCTTNPEGGEMVFTKRKNGKWIEQGVSMKNSNSISCGRHPFYDYNF